MRYSKIILFVSILPIFISACGKEDSDSVSRISMEGKRRPSLSMQKHSLRLLHVPWILKSIHCRSSFSIQEVAWMLTHQAPLPHYLSPAPAVPWKYMHWPTPQDLQISFPELQFFQTHLHICMTMA